MIELYRKIGIRSTKTGTCVCGKRATRTKEFYQTMNPFNKNEHGEIKSRSEIRAELREEARAWRDEPVLHAKCE